MGRNARFVMAGGAIAALFLPGPAEMLRPALPALVSLVMAMAMARIDLGDTFRSAIQPKRLFFLSLFSLALLPATALLYWFLALALPEASRATLILLAAAPPIASSAGISFLLGFNARLAVEVTVFTTLVTPILGPLIVAVFLPGAVPLSPLALAAALGQMIAGGVVLAVAIRWLMGPERIAAAGLKFDGVAAMVMVLFVIPLFDGVAEVIIEAPGWALYVLVLSCIFNWGANFAARAALLLRGDAATAGAVGVMMGNRTIAIYLAALPFNPDFALFVALYQFPMYFTPLAFARVSLR